MVMALPIRMLKGLRISIKEKIGVALIFSIGHVIIIFAILRVNELYISLSGADPNMNVSMSMWSVLEAAIGEHHHNISTQIANYISCCCRYSAFLAIVG